MKKSFLVSSLLEELPPLQDRQHRRASSSLSLSFSSAGLH